MAVCALWNLSVCLFACLSLQLLLQGLVWNLRRGEARLCGFRARQATDPDWLSASPRLSAVLATPLRWDTYYLKTSRQRRGDVMRRRDVLLTSPQAPIIARGVSGLFDRAIDWHRSANVPGSILGVRWQYPTCSVSDPLHTDVHAWLEGWGGGGGVPRRRLFALMPSRSPANTTYQEHSLRAQFTIGQQHSLTTSICPDKSGPTFSIQ